MAQWLGGSVGSALSVCHSDAKGNGKETREGKVESLAFLWMEITGKLVLVFCFFSWKRREGTQYVLPPFFFFSILTPLHD